MQINNFMETLKTCYKYFIILLLIGTSLIFLNGCSKHLSKEEAQKMILSQNHFPQTSTKEIRKKYYKNQVGELGMFGMPYIAIVNHDHDYKDSKELLSSIESKGLISVSEIQTFSNMVHFYWAIVNLTDEGKKYFASENNENFYVKCSETTFGEITGVYEKKGSDRTEVEYTVELKATPFGEIFNYKSESQNRTAIFSKTDDGWTINN
jgi:hypothetical protein